MTARLLILTALVVLSAAQTTIDFTSNSEVCDTQVCGDTLCSVDATCQDNSVCFCPNNLATWPEDNPVKCCYTRRLQWLVLLLEMFPSFGIGLLYVGRFGLGGAKLAFYFFLVYINYYWYRVSFMKDSEHYIGTKRRTTALFSIVVVAIWQITDLILILLNLHTDRKDVYPEGFM